MQRVSTGIKGLDKLLSGGIPSGTVVLLSGEPGAGKTLAGLSFLMEGAAKGEKCCYVSLSESKEELLRACEGIDTLKDLKKYLGKNLTIEHLEIGESISISVFWNMFDSYPRIDRLVIDSLNKVLIASENERAYRVRLSRLLRSIKQKADCTFLLCETERDMIDSGSKESFDCDGVIHLSFLDMEEKPLRTLQVYKMRYSKIEPRVHHELTVDSKGIRLKATKLV